MAPTLDAMNPKLVKYLKTQYDISLYCIVYTFLRFNLGTVEPLDDALLSTGFIISKEHTRSLSTLKRAPALSNSPP